MKKRTHTKQLQVDELGLQQTATVSPIITSEAPMDEILSLAQQLIQIKSTQENLNELEDAVSVIGSRLTDFTIETFMAAQKPSLLIHNAKPGTKFFKIILNAHLDVVHGKENQFIPYIANGKLYGRGAFDMKGAAATMQAVFSEVAKKVDYPLAFQIVADEELASGQGTVVQLDKGISTDLAIIGECGSNLDIIHENKGLVHAVLTTNGYRAHGAYPWKGKNAIIKMHEAINEIHKHFPVPENETFETTVTVTMISSSNQIWNLVPDHCSATLDIRVNRKDFAGIVEKIKSILPEGVQFAIDNSRNAHYADPENQYLKQLSKSIKTASGRTPKFRQTYGGADTVFFSERGSQAIEFGPIGHGQHHDDEWVDIQSLVDYYKILKNFLLGIK